jgi:hypothetical protein
MKTVLKYLVVCPKELLNIGGVLQAKAMFSIVVKNLTFPVVH